VKWRAHRDALRLPKAGEAADAARRQCGEGKRAERAPAV
jgi:hypothetical protein